MNLRTIICTILLFICGGFSTASTAEEQRFALVIGNSDYKQSPLKNPINDARDMQKMLERFDFVVTRLENANQFEMERAISDFRNDLDDDGVALFYFAGHGLQAQRENYLIPLRAKIKSEVDLRWGAIPVAQVIDMMESRGSGLNLVILDACRNEPYPSGYRSQQRGFARAGRTREGTYIMYATDPGTLAADGEGRNGVFTGALLEGLETDPSRSIERLFKDTSKLVNRYTNGAQTPWHEGVLLREFSFLTPEQMSEQTVTSSPNTNISDSPEREVWLEVKMRDSVDIYEQFIQQFPDGAYTFIAKIRVSELIREQEQKEDEEQNRKAQRVAQLTKRIKQRLSSLQLTLPPGDNANDLLQDLARLDPQNAYVEEGRQEIRDRYIAWIERELLQNQFNDAERYLDSLRRVTNSNAAVERIGNRIRIARERENARLSEEANKRSEQARLNKRQAEERKIAEQKERTLRIDSLIEQINMSISSNRLTRPEGNNANEQLGELASVDPGNYFIDKARDQVLDLYIGWITDAIEDGDIDKAERQLNSAALVTGSESRLAVLRKRVEESRQNDERTVIVVAPTVTEGETTQKCSKDVKACLEEGIRDFKDANSLEALNNFRKACNARVSRACTMMGIYFEANQSIWSEMGFKGVRRQDYEKAAEFYDIACGLKQSDACSRLGLLTYNGSGVRRNYRKASQLFEKGCIGQDGLGCAQLGILYKEGHGVFRNAAKSDALLKRACDYGYKSAC